MLPKAIIYNTIWDYLNVKFPEKVEIQEIFNTLPEVYQLLREKDLIPESCGFEEFQRQANQGLVKYQLQTAFGGAFRF
jgi:hypothetical protein